MKKNSAYHIGVDGGGTATRLILKKAHQQTELIRVQGPPSALGQGRQNAWSSILQTIKIAFDQISEQVPPLSDCSIGIGISGANNQKWKEEFSALNPGFYKCIVETDGRTTFLGAHNGGDGIALALGTGTVAVAQKNGVHSIVSGWGFPSGDEASGAWLGLKVAGHLQKTFDHREVDSEFSLTLKKEMDFTNPESFLSWLGSATQHDYAKFSPFVFEFAKKNDPFCESLIKQSLIEVEKILCAIDPDAKLALSLCGSVGVALTPFLPEKIKKRNSPPLKDSSEGALMLIEGVQNA